jgi:hypothetical protein
VHLHPLVKQAQDAEKQKLMQQMKHMLKRLQHMLKPKMKLKMLTHVYNYV